MSFPEFPAHLGFPSIFTGHWDPFFAACEETETVVCLHTGSSAWAPLPSPDPPFELLPTLFPVNALVAAAEWLWSGVPAPVPRPVHRPLRGRDGLGAHADRSGRLRPRPLGIGSTARHWPSRLLPSEVLRATSGSAPSTTLRLSPLRHVIGIEHIMVESDYPHADSTWPDTQAVVAASMGHLPEEELRAIAAGNAARLFDHPLPDADDWRRP